jgi:hypothetical protein
VSLDCPKNRFRESGSRLSLRVEASDLVSSNRGVAFSSDSECENSGGSRAADACDRSELIGASWMGVEADGDAGGDRRFCSNLFVCHVVWVGDGLTS